MKRNIIVSVKFEDKTMIVNAVEKLDKQIVEIYSTQSAQLKDSDKLIFVKESLKHIEKLIAGKIKEVTVIIDDIKSFNSKITISKSRVNLPSGKVSREKISTLINQVESEFSDEGQQLISTVPLKFEVHSGDEIKTYISAPIDKEGLALECSAVVTSISTKGYEYLQTFFKSAKVTITQILLNTQTQTQSQLSPAFLQNGSVYIDFSKSKTSVAINKFGNIVAKINIGYNYNHLVKAVMNKFNCNRKEAEDLILVNGSLLNVEDSIIFNKHSGLKHESFKASDLNGLIKLFLSRVAQKINEYIDSRMVGKLFMIVNGNIAQIEGFEEFMTEELQNKVFIYEPSTFVEKNQFNLNTIGAINWYNMLENKIGIRKESVVDTSPNTISTIQQQSKKKTLFAWFANKLGGKNEWR